jgi:fructosamine-3-kinase
VTPAARQAIAAATGAAVTHAAPLTGGCIGDVWRVDLADGRRLVAKTAGADGTLDIEGYMLDYLTRTHTVPVPGVIRAEPGLLVMEYVATTGRLDAAAQEHAADLLAALHGVTADAYGHERDTLIGSLRQPNPWTGSWAEFFRDQRLLYMGRLALDNGSLPRDTYARLVKFCETKLDAYIEQPDQPSLIHGDMWGGNVLVGDGRIAAFIPRRPGNRTRLRHPVQHVRRPVLQPLQRTPPHPPRLPRGPPRHLQSIPPADPQLVFRWAIPGAG